MAAVEPILIPSNLTPAGTRRILLLAGPECEDAAALPTSAEAADVRVVQTVDQAIAALRREDFDVAVASASEILPLARAIGRMRTEAALEHLGQGVCILQRDGRVAWANSKMRQHPPEVFDGLCEAAAALGRDLLVDFSKQQHASEAPVEPMKSRSIEIGRDFSFDLTVTAVKDPAGSVDQFVVLAWDSSSWRRLRDKINAIDAAGRELVGFDADALAKLDPIERLQLIEDKIIRCSHDLLHFDHFVVRILDRKTNRLDTVMASGLSEAAQQLPIEASEHNNGISGWVAATGRPYLCADVAREPRYLPGLEDARSSLTVPLQLNQQVIGIFNVESEQPNAFTEQDVQFAEIFARYVAMSLHILKLLVVERNTATGQLAADVDAETASPLSEIVRDVKDLMQDYSGDPRLGGRLKEILSEVDHVKEAIHAVTEPEAISGLIPAAAEVDKLIDGKRVLIADDEDIIRETIDDVLTQYGAITATATDGVRAVELLSNGTFDLVLSDIKMPRRSGYEVYTAAKAANPNCAVILITGFGYDPNHNIVKASKEGLSGVLFKPFKVDQLLVEVRQALSGGKASD